ncbi:hypothetical protein ACRRTK_001181 [Alexandromys fortis]
MAKISFGFLFLVLPLLWEFGLHQSLTPSVCFLASQSTGEPKGTCGRQGSSPRENRRGPVADKQSTGELKGECECGRQGSSPQENQRGPVADKQSTGELKGECECGSPRENRRGPVADKQSTGELKGRVADKALAF